MEVTPDQHSTQPANPEGHGNLESGCLCRGTSVTGISELGEGRKREMWMEVTKESSLVSHIYTHINTLTCICRCSKNLNTGSPWTQRKRREHWCLTKTCWIEAKRSHQGLLLTSSTWPPNTGAQAWSPSLLPTFLNSVSWLIQTLGFKCHVYSKFKTLDNLSLKHIKLSILWIPIPRPAPFTRLATTTAICSGQKAKVVPDFSR